MGFFSKPKKPDSKDTHQKYFGYNYGTGGRGTTKKFSTWSLKGNIKENIKTSMERFRRDSSGKGLNLSRKDINYISSEIAKLLKRLPTNKSYDAKEEPIPDYYLRQLLYKFKNDVQTGKIDQVDYDDVEKILKDIRI